MENIRTNGRVQPEMQQIKSKISAQHAPSGNAPERKFRAGPVSATIWQNAGRGSAGEPVTYKTVSLQRVYKDKNGAWQSTNSLRLADIPKAAVVLQKAYEYLVLRENVSEEGAYAEAAI